MDTKALQKIQYGLFVLSASDSGKDNACIVNTVVQVTSSPMCIAVTVNKQNLTHDMIAATNKFNVSVIDVTAPFAILKGSVSRADGTPISLPDLTVQSVPETVLCG